MLLDTTRQRALCDVVFQKLEDYAGARHSNVASIFRDFDKDQGGTLSTEEMQGALTKVCDGDLPPQQWQAVMTELDKDDTGQVSFERMFGTIREFKNLKRLARSHGQVRDPDALVRQFTNGGRWTDPSRRNQRTKRVTGIGTVLQKWRPPTVRAPPAAVDIVNTVEKKYTDFTGTSGGTMWHLIGNGEHSRKMQPLPTRTLFKRGLTLSEARDAFERAERPGANHPDNRGPWKLHSKRAPRAAGCSGFMAPRAAPPRAPPQLESRVVVTPKLCRPATVAADPTSRHERRHRSKRLDVGASKASRSSLLRRAASCALSGTRPLREVNAITNNHLRQTSSVETFGNPSLRLTLGVALV